MFLLDTNVVSELRKGERANSGVATWMAGVEDSDLYLSVLVAGEPRQGVERLGLRDAAAAAQLDRWCSALADGYAERLLPSTRA